MHGLPFVRQVLGSHLSTQLRWLLAPPTLRPYCHPPPTGPTSSHQPLTGSPRMRTDAGPPSPNLFPGQCNASRAIEHVLIAWPCFVKRVRIWQISRLRSIFPVPFLFCSCLKGLSHPIQSCFSYRSCMSKYSARSNGHVRHFFFKKKKILRSLQEINA